LILRGSGGGRFLRQCGTGKRAGGDGAKQGCPEAKNFSHCHSPFSALALLVMRISEIAAGRLIPDIVCFARMCVCRDISSF
jgi:hypothetical protein